MHARSPLDSNPFNDSSKVLALLVVTGGKGDTWHEGERPPPKVQEHSIDGFQMQLAFMMLLLASADVGAVPPPPPPTIQPGNPAPATVLPPPLVPYSPTPAPIGSPEVAPPAPPNMRWVLVDEATLQPRPSRAFTNTTDSSCARSWVLPRAACGATLQVASFASQGLVFPNPSP